MLNVIIGILVIIIIIYISVIFYQKHLLKQTVAMEKQSNRMKNLKLEESFKKISEIGLTGTSLKNVDDAYKEFQTITQNEFPKINRALANARKNSKGINFLKTRDECDQAGYLLEESAKKIDSIQSILEHVEKLNKEHKQAVADLEASYKQLRKILLTKNAEFGPAIDALEEQLSSIEGTFNDFSDLTQKGDHENAEKLLLDLNQATNKLENIIKIIPKLFKLNNVKYKNQIAEIESAYSKMKAEGFCFVDDDFDISLKELKETVADNIENIKHLDIEFVKDQDQEIESRINGLYDKMEKEMKARVKVEKQINIITKFIQHAKQQNVTLTNELERLSHNYSLEHGEIESAKDLGQRIDSIAQQHQQDLDKIKDRTAVYSYVLDNIVKFKAELTKIEKRQIKLNDSIADFSAEEKEAHQILADLTSELHAIQRRIENLNLPGIADDYVDYFGIVSDEVNHLNSTMNKVKISMDDVNKQLIQIKKDRDSLQEKTDDLIDQSVLAEQVMQYANRYVNSNPEIRPAMKKAKHLFDKDFHYDESLATIANAVDKVEPGAYRRIEDNYYNTKANKNK